MFKRKSFTAFFSAIAFLIASVAGTAAAGASVSGTDADSSSVLVAYFSATGSTEKIAQYIADDLNAAVFQILPEQPYTAEDLRYNDPDSRVSQERADPSLRDVALQTVTPANWDRYDTVFVGYPIWWGMAAWPVETFLRGNNWSGKTIIPFCTSGSSPIGSSAEELHSLAPNAVWEDGTRFSGSASDSAVAEWVASLDIEPAGPSAEPTAPSTEPAGEIELNDSAPEGVELVREGAGMLALTGIEAGTSEHFTSVETLLSWITTPNGGSIYAEDTDGSEASANTPAATGMHIVDVDPDGLVLSRALVIVTGDVLGTGLTSLSQLVRMAKALSGADPLEGAYLMAGDWDSNDAITLTDLVREAALYRGSAA